MTEFSSTDFPAESPANKIARISHLTGEEIASRLRGVKSVGRVVWRGYQIIATLLIFCLIASYVVLATPEYRDHFLPYKSNVFTKTCRATLANGTVLEGTRTVYDRYQSLGPMHWVSKTESSETTKITMRNEPLTVIGQTVEGELAYTKVFTSADRGDQTIKPADKLILVLGSKQDVAMLPYKEFCK